MTNTSKETAIAQLALAENISQGRSILDNKPELLNEISKLRFKNVEVLTAIIDHYKITFKKVKKLFTQSIAEGNYVMATYLIAENPKIMSRIQAYNLLFESCSNLAKDENHFIQIFNSIDNYITQFFVLFDQLSTMGRGFNDVRAIQNINPQLLLDMNPNDTQDKCVADILMRISTNYRINLLAKPCVVDSEFYHLLFFILMNGYKHTAQKFQNHENYLAGINRKAKNGLSPEIFYQIDVDFFSSPKDIEEIPVRNVTPYDNPLESFFYWVIDHPEKFNNILNSYQEVILTNFKILAEYIIHDDVSSIEEKSQFIKLLINSPVLKVNIYLIFHMALAYGDIKTIEFILSIPNINLFTPEHRDKFHSDFQIFLNVIGDKTEAEVGKNLYVSYIRAISKHGLINEKDRDGNTLLHFLAVHEPFLSAAYFDILLSTPEINIHVPNLQGNTAHHLALIHSPDYISDIIATYASAPSYIADPQSTHAPVLEDSAQQSIKKLLDTHKDIRPNPHIYTEVTKAIQNWSQKLISPTMNQEQKLFYEELRVNAVLGFYSLLYMHERVECASNPLYQCNAKTRGIISLFLQEERTVQLLSSLDKFTLPELQDNETGLTCLEYFYLVWSIICDERNNPHIWKIKAWTDEDQQRLIHALFVRLAEVTGDIDEMNMTFSHFPFPKIRCQKGVAHSFIQLLEIFRGHIAVNLVYVTPDKHAQHVKTSIMLQLTDLANEFLFAEFAQLDGNSKQAIRKSSNSTDPQNPYRNFLASLQVNEVLLKKLREVAGSSQELIARAIENLEYVELPKEVATPKNSCLFSSKENMEESNVEENPPTRKRNLDDGAAPLPSADSSEPNGVEPDSKRPCLAPITGSFTNQP